MYNNKFRNQNNNGNKGRNNSGNYRRPKPLRANAYQANSNNSNYRRLMNSEATTNQSKKPDDIPGSVPMLQYRANAESNLSKWIEAIQPVLECLFGHLASFISTDKYYKPKAPVPSAVAWTDQNDRGGLKRAIETENAREYAKQVVRLESDKPKMWGEIEKHMSLESKAQVKLDVDYNKLKEDHDVLGLWRLIKQVHRTQAGKLNVADASLDALTNYYTIKQKESENIVQFKDRLLAAVERVKTVDATKAPPEAEQARKFTKSLDPRKFNRLILECEQNEAKYEKTLAGALQQASLEKRLEGNSLVPCDQMIRTGGHFAGVAQGDNSEPIKLSRREQKIIMNIRKERQPYPNEGNDESDSRQPRGQKRGRDDYTAGYAGGKRPRYDKPSYDRNRDTRDGRYNPHDKGRKCVICNMNNHSTDECRNLTTAQDAVTQAKNKYRGDHNQNTNQANFGNQQRPILSGTSPLNQALTTQRSSHRSVILRE